MRETGMAFDLVRGSVRALLKNPHERKDWSLQGFGMLRCYLDDKRIARLHVWSKEHAYEDVSLVHDHPWDFRSLIVSGHLMNVRFLESRNGWGTEDYEFQTIQCGPGGCVKSAVQETSLFPRDPEHYEPGDSYEQRAEEIHASFPDDGCVSIITRKFHQNTENARVFWPAGRTWVSAEPRPATKDEIEAICAKALAVLDKNGN